MLKHVKVPKYIQALCGLAINRLEHSQFEDLELEKREKVYPKLIEILIMHEFIFGCK